MPATRPPTSLYALLLLKPYVMRWPAALVLVAIALVASTAITLAIPLALQRVIDASSPSADQARSADAFMLLIALGIGLAIASASRSFGVNWIGERVVTELRGDLFAHVTRLDIAYFDTQRSAELVNRLSSDMIHLRSMAAFAVSQSLRNAIMFVGAVTMMMVSSPTLAILVLVAIPAIVLPLFALGRVVRRLSRRAADRNSETLAYAAEHLAAVRTMQAFSQEATIGESFADADRHALQATLHRLIARSVLTGLALALVATAVVVILWWGSRLVAGGGMTTGLLGQFMLYTVLAGGAFAELAEILGELNQGSAAAARIQQVMAVEPTIRSPAIPEPLPTTGGGKIAFEAVSFAYPSRPEEAVLDQVSFSIREGERVAVVGPSGAGKSTIFSLILRFYDPIDGRVLVNGVAVNRAGLVELRRQMALVPQDIALFAASVADNIRYGSPAATPAAVIEAAKKAQAHGFIEALPQGYETRLGERGLTLSGGQRQRIAIARAILRDAPILLLDEATSALDSENERDVQIALDEVMQGRTTLIIAHRFSTIQKADRILVFDGGRLVEQGTHAELIARRGRYTRLAELQFEVAPEAAA